MVDSATFWSFTFVRLFSQNLISDLLFCYFDTRIFCIISLILFVSFNKNISEENQI